MTAKKPTPSKSKKPPSNPPIKGKNTREPPRKPNTQLNERQLKFAQEVVNCGVALEAYRRAGYEAESDNVAGVQSHALLKNPLIAKEIERLRISRTARTQITSDRTLEELAYLGFSDIGDILDISNGSIRLKKTNEIPESARRAISGIKVKRSLEKDSKGKFKPVEVISFTLWSKNEALKTIGKHLGIIKDSLNVNLKGKVQHDHSHEHTHSLKARELLDSLPLEVRKQLLETIQKRKEQAAIPQAPKEVTAIVIEPKKDPVEPIKE